jgi:hypothetical protein
VLAIRVSNIDIGNGSYAHWFLCQSRRPAALRITGERRKQQEPKMPTSERDPLTHTRNMSRRLQETIDHLRQDIEKVDEPQLKAMFETSAEVLGGLMKALRDYERKNEAAWRT